MKQHFQPGSKLLGLGLVTTVMLTANNPAHCDWKPSFDAVQRVYLGGVPHTDANGKPLLKYDALRSFLPIAIYHGLETTESDGTAYHFSDLTKAGFNTTFPWWGTHVPTALKAAEAAKIQLVMYGDDFKDPDLLSSIVKSPAVLAYNMDDEPIGSYGNGIEKRFESIEQRAAKIRKADKTHPLMLIDAPWIDPPATSWWMKLNTWGDITSHDGYPITGQNNTLGIRNGIADSISLAVASNKEKKPMWFVAQAHQYPDPVFPCVLPTAAQQRCMTYTALIHGATGIIHFALDSFVTRDGRCIGISPNPKAKYTLGGTATESELQQSRTLWDATVRLNGELNTLRPSLLSPTADISYEVSIDDKWKTVSKTPIRTLLKTNHAGGYTLLLANIDSAFEGVRIRFPGKKFTVKQMFNQESAGQFELKDDGFEMLCAPYEVRVFQMNIGN